MRLGEVNGQGCRGGIGLAAMMLLLVAACSSTAPTQEPVPPAPVVNPSGGPAPAPGVPPAPVRPSLLDEQRRLSALFEGTPVVFALQADGRLRVDVPLRNSFDAGRAEVKPALAAVLDRIALSQAGGGSTSRIVVAACADRSAAPAARAASGAVAARPASGAAPPKAGAAAAASKAASGASARQDRLAADRAASTLDRLRQGGIAASRLGTAPATAAGSTIRLWVDDRPAP